MNNVISLNRNNESIFIDTHEKFSEKTLCNLICTVSFDSLKKDSFTLGLYRYISEENNMYIIGAYKGKVIFDDSFKIKENININDFSKKTAEKIKKLTITK